MEEVGIPTQTGGPSSSADAEETATATAGSGETEEARVAGLTAMMDIAAVTGVYAGDKVIYPAHPQDGQIHKCGQQNHPGGGILG